MFKTNYQFETFASGWISKKSKSDRPFYVTERTPIKLFFSKQTLDKPQLLASLPGIPQSD